MKITDYQISAIYHLHTGHSLKFQLTNPGNQFGAKKPEGPSLKTGNSWKLLEFLLIQQKLS